MSNIKKLILENEILDPSYATKQELNDEAIIRAKSDEIIVDDLNILRRTQNKKIDDLNIKVVAESEKINNLDSKVKEVQGSTKNSQDRIDDLEGCFFKRIKELENENNDLYSQLKDASEVINQKDDEIKELQDELKNNGLANEIDLKFNQTPEFSLTEVISVKEFINNNLKEVVIPKMKIRYPDAEFSRDYTLMLDNLNYQDVMQGKNVIVFVKAIETGNLIGQSDFVIKVTYNYDVIKQEKFIEQLLQPAIPSSLRNVPENVAANYNVPEEIINTQPLKLLLNNQFKHLTFKIFAEMNAGSYWTDFHRSWQFIRDGYVGTGQSIIGSEKNINSVNDLYNTTSGYYNNIFKIIEARINNSDIPCAITKKWARTSDNNRVLHNVGNLVFNVSNTNLDNDEIVFTQMPNYYLMINFEIDINGIKKFYRGVTLILTDGLELYI